MGSAVTPQAAVAAQSVDCASCHRREAESYDHAPMRLAMSPVGTSSALQAHPTITLEQNGYTYTVQTKDGKSTYTVTDGTNTLTIPIRWALGMRSQTWLLEKDGHYYESLVSYFQRDQSLGTTPGDDNIVPHTIDQAMGRELSIWEVRDCFTCHASGYHPDENLDGQKLTPGVNCERCHAGAIEHSTDALHKDLTTLPDAFDDRDAGQISDFCGRCHRTWDRVVREGWHGPPTVRFQPYRLANSRCFDARDKRISCLACHDPHKDDTHDEAFYDSKCLACHAGTASPAARSMASSTAVPKVCPVAKDNCVSCHMPKVALAGGHAVFTDHEIRIVRPGDQYPN